MLEASIRRRFERYELIKANETDAELYLTEDCDILLCAYGATARVAKSAVNSARERGIRAGLFRPKTLWPFPVKEINKAAKTASALLTVEMSMGQMAPTPIPGQVTQTTPYGRDPQLAGYPVRICEMLSTLTGTAYAERVAADTIPHIRAAKKAIRKAFENQKAKRGFSIVEVLSTCPTNWGMTPLEAIRRLQDEMIPYYPLGVYKDITAEGGEAQ